MSKLIIDVFYSFIKRHPGYSFLIGTIFGGLLINLAAELISQEYGIYRGLVVLVFALVFLLVIVPVYCWYEERKEKKVPDFNFGDVEKKKGLITLISKLSEPKERIVEKLNSIDNLEDIEGLNNLYTVRGIGQTFLAITHHLKELKVCWLLYTDGSVEGKELVEQFIRKFGSWITPKPIRLEDPNQIKSVYKIVNDIYAKEREAFELQETDVIADITGGLTTMSSAVILACTSSDRDMEYVEQDTNKLIKIEHI